MINNNFSFPPLTLPRRQNGHLPTLFPLTSGASERPLALPFRPIEPTAPNCLPNRQTRCSARGCCEACYQNRKNLWISRPIRRPETRMKATHRATAHPAQASRIAPQPSRPRLSDFRLPGFQTARRRLACEIWIQNFAEKLDKPSTAPVNTAQGAINSGKICG